MRRRFTLFELLLAFTVLLILLTMLSLSFRTVRNSWQNMGRNATRIERLMRINYFADNYLRNIELQRVPLEVDGSAELFFRGGSDYLTASSIGRTSSAAKPGIAFLDLRLNEDGELVLITSPSPFVPKELRSNADTYILPAVAEVTILAEGVKSFAMSYAEIRNGILAWENEWSDSRVAAQGLPAAVLLQIEFADGTKEAILRRIGGIQSGTAHVYRRGIL